MGKYVAEIQTAFHVHPYVLSTICNSKDIEFTCKLTSHYTGKETWHMYYIDYSMTIKG